MSLAAHPWSIHPAILTKATHCTTIIWRLLYALPAFHFLFPLWYRYGSKYLVSKQQDYELDAFKCYLPSSNPFIQTNTMRKYYYYGGALHYLRVLFADRHGWNSLMPVRMSSPTRQQGSWGSHGVLIWYLVLGEPTHMHFLIVNVLLLGKHWSRCKYFVLPCTSEHSNISLK